MQRNYQSCTKYSLNLKEEQIIKRETEMGAVISQQCDVKKKKDIGNPTGID